ncbi:hypothetical protein GGI15_004133, partial [Coemansia interrupta]
MFIDPLAPVAIEPTTRCLLLRGRNQDGAVCFDMYVETSENATAPPPILPNQHLPDTVYHLLRATHHTRLLSSTRYTLVTASGRSVGRLSANALGTRYTVHQDTNDESTRDPKDGQDVCVIRYQPNVLGRKGPRQMTVEIPTEDSAGGYKANGSSDSAVVLCNRMPEWCARSNAFVLDFEGRVSVPSVKNFQLVHPDEDAYVVLQFGRVADHMFTLDMRYPMSPMLALAIAASNMDRKLA